MGCAQSKHAVVSPIKIKNDTNENDNDNDNEIENDFNIQNEGNKQKQDSSTRTAPRVAEHRPNGVSVHWLKYGFLREVREAGLDNKSTIYQVENLNEAKPGVIRRKGAHIRCPRDGGIGAAYVDCLQELEYVGPADMMLSYGWGNTVGDIVDTLVDYCSTQQMDPKHTYVWICCLCNNQHRIFDNRQNGISKSVDDFRDKFNEFIPSVRRVVSVMSPWNKPICLTRAWCIFELYTAIENDHCELTIGMPNRERIKMNESLMDINKLFDTLSNINIEEAQVSVGDDKTRILSIVREFRIQNIVHKLPPCTRLNNRVHEWLRERVRDNVREQIYIYEKENGDISVDLDFADLCRKVGHVMNYGGRHDDAIFLYRRALKVRKNGDGHNDRESAELYTDIGSIMLDSMFEYDGALLEYEKAAEIYETVLGRHHADTATAYCKIGKILDNHKCDYDAALLQYRKAGEIYQRALGKHHPFNATLHNNIGLTMDSKGDYDNALVEFRKAVLIEELVYGKEHVTTAATYNNIGGALYEKGDIDAALIEFERAHAVNIKVLGDEHALTIITSDWIKKLSSERKVDTHWAQRFRMTLST